MYHVTAPGVKFDVFDSNFYAVSILNSGVCDNFIDFNGAPEDFSVFPGSQISGCVQQWWEGGCAVHGGHWVLDQHPDLNSLPKQEEMDSRRDLICQAYPSASKTCFIFASIKSLVVEDWE